MPSKLICLGFIFSFIFLFCPINCENSKNQKLGEYIVSITFLDEIMSGRCEHNMELNNEYSDLFSLLDGKIRDEFKNVKLQYDRGYKNNSIKLLIPAIGKLVKKLMSKDSTKIKNKGNFQKQTQIQPFNRKSHVFLVPQYSIVFLSAINYCECLLVH
uniref:Uncharacterized protein n=1 Tax=Meloidogyne enterolobii TaxID=390850 RepID=A0A6V7UTA7_MELEN|nr:unnamed protein product [Meloidogyne enterolobii]